MGRTDLNRKWKEVETGVLGMRLYCQRHIDWRSSVQKTV